MFKGITVALLALRNTPLFKPEALNLIKTAYHLSKSCTVRPLSRLELQIYVSMSFIVCTISTNKLSAAATTTAKQSPMTT